MRIHAKTVDLHPMDRRLLGAEVIRSHQDCPRRNPFLSLASFVMVHTARKAPTCSECGAAERCAHQIVGREVLAISIIKTLVFSAAGGLDRRPSRLPLTPLDQFTSLDVGASE